MVRGIVVTLSGLAAIGLGGCAKEPIIYLKCQGVEEGYLTGEREVSLDVAIDPERQTLSIWNESTATFQPRQCEDCDTEVHPTGVAQDLREEPGENSFYIDRMTGKYSEKIWSGDPEAVPLLTAHGTCEPSDPPLDRRVF